MMDTLTKKQKNTLARVLLAAGLTVLLLFLPVSGAARFCLFLIPYLIVGYDVLLRAFRGVRNGQVFDENFLMAVATLGALLLSALKTGDSLEAVAVMLFYQVGELFQGIAVGKSRRSIAALMDIRPDTARLQKDGAEEIVDPEEVPVGSVICVHPGERIPIDGTVVTGEAMLDTAALTGESVPRHVRPGSEALSGCIVSGGALVLKTTKPFSESTASRVLDLVENASSRKSKSEDFIAKFARIYTPAVCFSALALCLLPPLVLLALGRDPRFSDWLYRALTFLVISCPCALVISIPLTFFASLGGISRAGVLVKGANFLETLSRVKIVVLDKTGTLTRGVFTVRGIHHAALPQETLLEYAALAESQSSHPIALSLQKAYGKRLDPARVADIREIEGEGVTALVDGKAVAAGNEALMARLGIESEACGGAGTVVHLAVSGAYAGHILIADEAKETAGQAIKDLFSAGVRRVVMLTGDRKSAAGAMAAELGIPEWHGELLPQDKVAETERLRMQKQPGEALAFAGDGINDAPVLSLADVGIAMGALGSDAAIEAADVVLMDDDPKKIAKAIRCAGKCMRVVRENLIFAIGVKLLCLLLSALGLSGMGLAIFADVGVMVLAVLNAMRTLSMEGV